MHTRTYFRLGCSIVAIAPVLWIPWRRAAGDLAVLRGAERREEARTRGFASLSFGRFALYLVLYPVPFNTTPTLSSAIIPSPI